MSKLLKRLNDNQNKVADTNGIMKLQAWDYGVAQDLTNKKITATVANASGFLFDIDLVSNGTEIDLDFKDSQLQKLTPDTYYLEIKVTDADGDVSVFPTEGYATFTINKNLHATEGELVPQITFDTVLADVKTAMDEKVADYVKTIAKGDKGDTGPQGAPGANGKDGVVDYSKTVNITGDQTVAGTKTFSSAINGNLSGNASTADKLRTARKIGGVSFDGTQDIDLAGVNKIGNQDTTGNAARATTLLTQDIYGNQDLNNYVNNGIFSISGASVTNSPTDTKTWVTLVVFRNIEKSMVTVSQLLFGQASNNVYTRNLFGETWSSWVKLADDSTLVHNTGNEIIAGNKTFSGNTTIGGTLMTNSGWKNMSLVSGVTATVARYRLLNGVVYIQVLDVTADVGKVFATLPAGYRPQHWIWESYFSANKSGNFLIGDNGEVSRASSTTSGTDSGTKASFEVSYPID